MNPSPLVVSRIFTGIVVLIMVLIGFASVVALRTENFYAAETANWKAQSIGQDIINVIVLVPALILSLLVQIRNKSLSYALLAGSLLYLVYTFTIYCFSVHFNSLFLVYIAILGLSFYTCIYYLLQRLKAIHILSVSPGLRITIGVYLVIVSCLFVFLWFSDIARALIHHRLPKGLQDTGLLTNPVHVLDLSVVLPALFMVGILLLQNHRHAASLAIIIITFSLLMNFTIAGLIFSLHAMHQSASFSVAYVMTALAIFDVILLILLSRSQTSLSTKQAYESGIR